MSGTVSTYATVPVQHIAISKVAGLQRLFWKEYRSIRIFWLSVIVLSMLLAWLISMLSQSPIETLTIIYNFALGAPAFFAIGAAGAAFAAEKEEGTFEFLRASPVSAAQVVASKLISNAVATVLMFAILWPIALFISGSHLPDVKELTGMLGLWLVGAVEAIAWGTLFSLLGARPLLAVVLAIAVASTCAHVISWGFRDSTITGFQWMAYYRAAPWRALLALIVMGVDVYLGMRWLNGDRKRTHHPTDRVLAPLGQGARERYSLNPQALAHRDTAQESVFQRLLVKRSFAAMLGRLLWQHWRQSRWLMITMLLVGVPIITCCLAVTHAFTGRIGWSIPDPFVVLLIAWSSLVGSFVFLADQERRNYRFLAEHNVPPRYVWMSRQMPWLAILASMLFVICFFWLKTRGSLDEIWRIVKAALHSGYYDFRHNQYYPFILELPPLHLGLACAAVAYAAGQWISMLVRSGIMAGFIGLVLSAGLCGWTMLMRTMEVSFWWSVMPIPFVLLFATWLRAPDWISEDKRTSVRVRAAAIVLLPAAALAIAVPVYRVHQVPLLSPGFDVAQYETQIKAKLDAGLATAKMYRDAADALRRIDWNLDDLPGASHLDESEQIALADHHAEIMAALKRARDKNEDPPNLRDLAIYYSAEVGQEPTEAEKKWLDENVKSLELLIAAAQQPDCIFFDPATAQQFAFIVNRRSLVQLMLTSGRELTAEGKLDEALDRYFAALVVVRDIYSDQMFYLSDREMTDDLRRVFLQIADWSGQKGQTPQRLRAAIAQLQATDASVLRMDDLVKNNYLLTQRLVTGDSELRQHYYPANWPQKMQHEILWSTLMPWEQDRAVHVLNALTKSSLYRLQLVQFVLAAQGQTQDDPRRALVQFAAEGTNAAWFPDEIDVLYGKHYPELFVREMKEWLPTTNPDLSEIENLDKQAAAQLIAFEAQKRGTMIVLAIAAYRLEHGELPKSLSDLRGDYFQRWPLDPYSGYEFRYFPEGIPSDGTEESKDPSVLEIRMRDGGPTIFPGQPGVWCSAPNLVVGLSEENWDETTESVNPKKNVRRWYYYDRLSPLVEAHLLPLHEVWSRGTWFSIPAAPK